MLDIPLRNEGPADFYPPVCLQSHWDPTKILRWTLPTEYVGQPLDPRPWTRICMEYTSAGPAEEAPAVAKNVVMPPGGQFYPPTRYAAAIDDETRLRGMDRPLGTCEADQWLPGLKSDMFDSRILVPRTNPVDPSRIAELAYPRALLRSGPYECREAEDIKNVAASSEFAFNNATKQDRYKQMGKATRPAAPADVLRAAPERGRPDLTVNAGRPMFAQGSYEATAANQRAELAAGTAAERSSKVTTNLNTPGQATYTYRTTTGAPPPKDSQVAAYRASRGAGPAEVDSGPAGVL